MAGQRLKAARFGVLRFAMLYIVLCCLSLMAIVGCGPSEQEIKATVVAGIQATATAVTVESTAAAIANLPPTATSPAGLQLPVRLRPSPVPHEKMSLEEARRMYREIGCTGCATMLAEYSPKYPPNIVITGTFLGDDNLPDSITFRTREHDVLCTAFINTGVSLEYLIPNRAGKVPYSGERWTSRFDIYSTKEEFHDLFQATSEAYELLNVNDHILLILGLDLKKQGGEYGITNLTTNTSPIDDGRPDTLAGIHHWYGDFDNDNEIEVGLLQVDNSLRIIETDRLTTNGEATNTISLAAKDYASNLLTEDAADFEALWREHGPSASVAALALVLDVSFNRLLDELYAAVDNEDDIRETVLAIRRARR